MESKMNIDSMESGMNIFIYGLNILNLFFFIQIYKNRILRLNNDGSLDSSFNSNASIVNSTSSTPSFVQTISIQSNGKIIFGGNFDYASSNTYRNNIASINVDGSIDNSFFPFIENSLSSNNSIRAIGLQSDGKIIIGGFFASYNGVSANRIARLNTDGTLDTTFNIGTGANGAIQDLKVLSNDKIVIVGDFTTFNGITKNKVAMLWPDCVSAMTVHRERGSRHLFIHSAFI